MSGLFYAGIALTIALIVAAGVLSGRKVKSGDDFSRGRSGFAGMTGTILGVLIGGSCTIGTSQLAFTYGFSALWFTVGTGLAVLIMSLFMSDRVRGRGVLTVAGLIGSEYGQRARTLNAILSTIGVMFNGIAQILSGTAIIAIVFPDLPLGLQALFVAVIMLLYMIFGGMKSISAAGSVKAMLILPAMFICGAIALNRSGGFGKLQELLPREQYFNLLARGAGTDLSALLSTIMGGLTSQSYMQIVMSAGNDKIARQSLRAAAVPALPLGLAGVAVGLYMRSIAPAEVLASPELTLAAAKTALPGFIQAQFPPFFSGMILSTLFITAVGSGAALALGAGTIVKRDIVDRLTDRFREGRKALAMSRLILVVMLGALALCIPYIGSYVMDMGILSHGLRAASTLAPFLFALLLPGRIRSGYAAAAMLIGVGIVLVLKLINSPLDAALTGVVISVLVMCIGLLRSRDRNVPAA